MNVPRPSRILVVEDDEAIGSSLQGVLEGEGYVAEWRTTAADALQAAATASPDLVLLDLGLPDGDGIDVCRRLRALPVAPAIVILTARADEMDVVVGLDAGADDYVRKPFRLAELLARVRAHLRRSDQPGSNAPLAAGIVAVDRGSRRAWSGDVELVLRPKEFDLLALLVAEAGRAVRRERIMSEVWDENWFGSTKTLDQHVAWLRQKLEAAGAGTPITTLRGVGYRFESE